MTQQQLLQTFLPILILLPVLYLRMRRMSGTRPLKLNRLWIQPAIILCLVTVALMAPQPHHAVRHFMASDWAWLALAAALGAVGVWYWGRTMKIDVHPEDGTLIVTGGQAATPTQDSSVEARAREMVREELDMREREDLRAFERQHPFTAMMCQGDRACLRDARR